MTPILGIVKIAVPRGVSLAVWVGVLLGLSPFGRARKRAQLSWSRFLPFTGRILFRST